MIPSVGRIVHYTLNENEAAEINRRRADASANMRQIIDSKTGYQAHVGSQASEGRVYPMIVTRVWGAEEGASVNGQVFLDGNDLYWATSRTEGEGPGHWQVPPRVG